MRQLYQPLPVTWRCTIKKYLLENCNVARPFVKCMRNGDKKPCIELARVKIRRIDICIYCRYRSAISSIEEASLHVTVFELFQLMLLLFLLISSFHHCTLDLYRLCTDTTIQVLATLAIIFDQVVGWRAGIITNKQQTSAVVQHNRLEYINRKESKKIIQASLIPLVLPVRWLML